MNKQNILRLADALDNVELAKSHNIGFNMATFVSTFDIDRTEHDCGTVACIAGWAVAMFGHNGKPRASPLSAMKLNNFPTPEEHATRTLGLSYVTAQSLFYPGNPRYHQITPKVAAATLRHLAETGVVDWDRHL